MKVCLRCSQGIDVANWQCRTCGWEAEIVGKFPALAPELAATGKGFDPSFFSELAHLESGSFWFRSRNKLIIWALHYYFPKTKSFLEIGCGTGYVLSGIADALPQICISGSEIFTQGLEYAAARLPNANFIQMDARHIPYESEFDVIGAFDVLEHIIEDDLVLQEIGKALKPGGGLIITVPQHQFLWSAADEKACHVRRYSSFELKEKVQRNGFKVCHITSFVSFLLPFMFFSRWRKKNSKEHYSLELSLPVFIDFILEIVMRLEAFIIKIGFVFPIGGSILLIAEKG